jgi:hypothetical protein
MEAMFYLGFVKEHGEGTKRMRETMTGMHLPTPEFEQSTTGTGATSVRVTLRNNVKQRRFWIDSDVSKILGEAMVRNLSVEEKRVLNFVVEHGSINVSECLRLIPTFPKWHAAKIMLEKKKTTGLLDRKSNRSRDPHARYLLPRALPVPDGEGNAEDFLACRAWSPTLVRGPRPGTLGPVPRCDCCCDVGCPWRCFGASWNTTCTENTTT